MYLQLPGLGIRPEIDSRKTKCSVERNTMAPIVFLVGNTMGWRAIVFRSTEHFVLRLSIREEARGRGPGPTASA